MGACCQAAPSLAGYSNGVNKSLAMLMDHFGIPKTMSYLRQGMYCMYM